MCKLYAFTLKCDGENYHKDVLASDDETAIATIIWYIGKTFADTDTVTFTYQIVE